MDDLVEIIIDALECAEVALRTSYDYDVWPEGTLGDALKKVQAALEIAKRD